MCFLETRSVVAEYVKAREVLDFQMTGRQRRDLFISYIAALERHELKMPRLEPFRPVPKLGPFEIDHKSAA